MKRKKRKNQTLGPVWIFVDLFLLLCAAFLLTSEPERKESNDTNQHTSPKIFLFLEEKNGEYGIKLNGRQITKGKLSEIIRSAINEKVHHVEVIAKVENQIPNGFVLDVKDVALSSGIVNEDGEKNLKVVWDNQRLTSHSLNQQ